PICSDLIHLALGGIMMNCGYDPDPNLEYDTPPIAPQIWHAYHIAGEQLATGIIAALIHRERSGEGQDVAVAIHEAVAKNPEQDIMYWVMRRVPLWRLTNRHAGEFPNHSPSISHTKDGRWFITHGMGARDLKNLVPLLSNYSAQADLQPPPPDADLRARQVPGTAAGGEATEGVRREPGRQPSVPARPRRVEQPRLSALHNKPFPLQGVKIFDFAWFLASAGGTRFLSALGAESFKVEWKDNPDTRLAAM